MQSPPGEASLSIKKEAIDYSSSSFAAHSNLQSPVEVSSSSEEDNSHETEDANEQSTENASKQIVLYDPVANGSGQIEIVPQPLQCRPHPSARRPGFLMHSRVLPSVGAFTVQCAKCFKWRLIPTKEKYEEIREHILEQPFYCETAREWRPDISCNDPADISQDGSRLWAIDKPNIAQPPRGWQRLLRIRGEGSSKFADVYYQAPSGKRLRSMVEIERYLMANPEYVQNGVKLSQFSFQIPRPLQENYVRKRPARLTASCDNIRPLEPSEGM
ncbi:DNA binding protein, putative [Ricinus communis]|uniref:DNA binding protein, putative n=1 Tax=Ricinus communis TaxID=3988 RepID=B9SJS0_RICCO|nr:DNA binding protein, putative [Ricinus communis]